MNKTNYTYDELKGLGFETFECLAILRQQAYGVKFDRCIRRAMKNPELMISDHLEIIKNEYGWKAYCRMKYETLYYRVKQMIISCSGYVDEEYLKESILEEIELTKPFKRQ